MFAIFLRKASRNTRQPRTVKQSLLIFSNRFQTLMCLNFPTGFLLCRFPTGCLAGVKEVAQKPRGCLDDVSQQKLVNRCGVGSMLATESQNRSRTLCQRAAFPPCSTLSPPPLLPLAHSVIHQHLLARLLPHTEQQNPIHVP